METGKRLECFARSWAAEVLAARPLILPGRSFVYPAQADEVERGALEVLVRPGGDALPFLATCALGFRDPAVPTGVWATPHPDWMCAVAGGYTYLIHTREPEEFAMVPYRPVMQVVEAEGLLLFVGSRAITAWGLNSGIAGWVWESERLSDEGVTLTGVEDGVVRGTGWELRGDKEIPFALDVHSGR